MTQDLQSQHLRLQVNFNSTQSRQAALDVLAGAQSSLGVQQSFVGVSPLCL
jgi:hypothetical protein